MGIPDKCNEIIARRGSACRSNLGEVDVAAPLLRLTEEDDAVVAWQAAAALANLTVDCTAVKVGLHRVLVGSGVRMEDTTVTEDTKDTES